MVKVCRLRPRWFVYLPLITYIIPTLIIGYGFVIPRSCIAGFNELTIGFGSAMAGVCLAYWFGVRAASRGAS
jgi:hypothetical protein